MYVVALPGPFTEVKGPDFPCRNNTSGPGRRHITRTGQTRKLGFVPAILRRARGCRLLPSSPNSPAFEPMVNSWSSS